MPKAIEPTKAENKNVFQSVIVDFYLQLLIDNLRVFAGTLVYETIGALWFCLPKFLYLLTLLVNWEMDFLNADPRYETVPVSLIVDVTGRQNKRKTKQGKA